MTISKKELLEDLKSCIDCAGKSNFIFHEGKIISIGMFVSISINIAGSEELEGAVVADTFFKAISKLNGDEINLTMDDEKKSFIVKCGKSKLKINNISKEYIESDVIEALSNVDSWLDIPETLLKGFELCSIEKNRTPLNSICIYGKRMFSTDRSQLISYTLDKEVPDFVIPQDSVNILIKFLKKLKLMAITDSYAHFKNDDMTLSLRLNAKGSYVTEASLDKILNDENNVCLSGTLPDKLINSVDRASLFGEDDGSNKIIVTVVFDNKVIHIHSESANGEFAEDIESDLVPDTPVVCYMTYNILSFLLKRPSTFKLVFNNTLNIGNKIIFESENCKYVSMLYNGNGR